MRVPIRFLIATAAFLGGGLLLAGYAFASHRAGTLHTCVSSTGAIKVAANCQAKETAVVLVTDEALTAIEARLAAVEADNTSLKSRVGALETRVGTLESTLAGVARSGNTLTFAGMNLQVMNGAGKTESTNGLGNLIIGYNEEDRDFPSSRSGSHNLVVGDLHTYSSYGGLVVGRANTLTGPFASVTGENNAATGGGSSVSGGYGNLASGNYASVSGGQGNTASSLGSSVSGGARNAAAGLYSSVSGGLDRAVDHPYDWRAGLLFQDQ